MKNLFTLHHSYNEWKDGKPTGKILVAHNTINPNFITSICDVTDFTNVPDKAKNGCRVTVNNGGTSSTFQDDRPQAEIAAILIELAINDNLPLDLNELREDDFITHTEKLPQPKKIPPLSYLSKEYFEEIKRRLENTDGFVTVLVSDKSEWIHEFRKVFPMIKSIELTSTDRNNKFRVYRVSANI